MWGPRDREGTGEQVVVEVRRYLCRACGAVLTVVPRELLPGRLYGATAIALALALWGLERRSAQEVRQTVASWWLVREEVRSWASLRRWAAEARDRKLWPRLHVVLCGDSRDLAGEVASALAGFAPPTDRAGPMTARTWTGAMHAM